MKTNRAKAVASDVGGMVRAAKEELAFVGGGGPESAPLYS